MILILRVTGIQRNSKPRASGDDPSLAAIEKKLAG